MNEIINFTKSVLVALAAWVLALMTNHHDAIYTLFFGFVLDVAMGIGADVNILKNPFSMKKALGGLKLLLFYFALIIFIHIAMSTQYLEAGTTMVTWLTYIVGYFYVTNIFRNAEIIFPGNKAISFIYSFLSTEVIFKLKEFLGFKKEEESKQENE